MPLRPYRPIRTSLLALLLGLASLPAHCCAEATGTPPPTVVKTRLAVAPLPSTGEVVRIDDIDYPVPRPWTGNRVSVPEDTTANLQMIPQELTLNRTEIFLHNEAIEPLRAMAAAAAEAGVLLLVDSGYRSARYQRVIFRQFLEKGQRFENIARYVAPPGYSEHALGTVVDFHPSGRGFARSDAYRWLREHAATYGFHETLPRHGRHHFPWEPWHWKFQSDAADDLPRLAPHTVKRRPAPLANTLSVPAVNRPTIQAASAESLIEYQ